MTLEAARGPRVQTLATPWPVFRKIEAALGERFELDVCAEPETAKCDRFFTVEDDALTRQWRGLCWCNPPYNEIGAFMAHARKARDADDTRTVFLVPARTGMRWFLAAREDEARGAASIAFWPGRIAFLGSGSAPYEYSAVIGIGRRLARLRDVEGDCQPFLFGDL